MLFIRERSKKLKRFCFFFSKRENFFPQTFLKKVFREITFWMRLTWITLSHTHTHPHTHTHTHTHTPIPIPTPHPHPHTRTPTHPHTHSLYSFSLSLAPTPFVFLSLCDPLFYHTLALHFPSHIYTIWYFFSPIYPLPTLPSIFVTLT